MISIDQRSIKFIRILLHQVELEGISSQAGVEVAGVYVGEEYSLLRDYEIPDSLVNGIVEGLLDADELIVECY